MGLADANNSDNWRRINVALQNIAIDSKTWDCWINHYVGNSWAELRDEHSVAWAFEALGWSESTWKSPNREDWPETEQKTFGELSPAETRAAERICCPAEIWNGLPLTQWGYSNDGISITELEFETKYIVRSSIRLF